MTARYYNAVRFMLVVILVALVYAWAISVVTGPRTAKGIFSVAFSPNGSVLATGADNGTAILWDPVSGKRVSVLNRDGYPSWAKFAVFAPQGGILAIGGDSPDVRLVDAETGERRATLTGQFGNSVNCGVFSPKGDTFVTGREHDGTVWSLDPPKERVLLIGHKQRINGVAFSPDGKLLATASDDQTVKLWNVTTGDRRHTLVAGDYTKLRWFAPFLLWALVWWLVWKKGRTPRLAIPPQTMDAVGLANRESSSQGTGPQPVATLPGSSEEASQRAGVPRQPEISIAILVIGAVAYGVLCLPAIGRRGYPPTHPFWMAMPWLWLAPIVLCGIFDSGVFKSRRRHLAIYALATAFVDAGTMGGVVPRSMDPLIMVVATLFMYGPAHLVVTAVLEVAIQPFLRVFRKLIEGVPTAGGPQRWQQIPVGVRCLFLLLSALTVGFPFAFAKLSTDWEYNRGRSRADEDWANHDAVIYGDSAPEYVGEVCMGFLRRPRVRRPCIRPARR